MYVCQCISFFRLENLLVTLISIVLQDTYTKFIKASVLGPDSIMCFWLTATVHRSPYVYVIDCPRQDKFRLVPANTQTWISQVAAWRRVIHLNQLGDCVEVSDSVLVFFTSSTCPIRQRPNLCCLTYTTSTEINVFQFFCLVLLA